MNDDKQQEINDALEVLASAVRDGSFPKDNPSFVSLQNFPLICARITNLDKTMIKLAEVLDQKYVTKEAFSPVQSITYGMVGLVLTSVLGALLALVIMK